VRLPAISVNVSPPPDPSENEQLLLDEQILCNQPANPARPEQPGEIRDNVKQQQQQAF
jgi:hypothetical protein